MTTQPLILSAIVAMAENRVIGKDNRLPWHLPADLQHFKSITTGHTIIMGRKTYESIGRPLPNRTNIILTRDKQFSAPGCVVCTSLEEALRYVDGSNEAFIIGGAEIYRQLLAKVQRIYLTIVHEQIVGDAYFPELDEKEWKEVKREAFEADDRNEYGYSFVVMEK